MKQKNKFLRNYQKQKKNVKQIDVNVADLSDVQIQGTFVVDEEYYIYERNTEGDTGFKKYLSRFSPKQTVGSSKYLFKVKYLGEDKFQKIGK